VPLQSSTPPYSSTEQLLLPWPHILCPVVQLRSLVSQCCRTQPHRATFIQSVQRHRICPRHPDLLCRALKPLVARVLSSHHRSVDKLKSVGLQVPPSASVAPVHQAKPLHPTILSRAGSSTTESPSTRIRAGV
jgi:hypothetical protein